MSASKPSLMKRSKGMEHLTQDELDRYFELDEKVKKVVEEIAPLCTDITSREEIERIEDDKNGTITVYVYSSDCGHDWYEIPKNYLFMSIAEIKDEMRKRREEEERRLEEERKAEEKRKEKRKLEREKREYERLKKKFE